MEFQADAWEVGLQQEERHLKIKTIIFYTALEVLWKLGLYCLHSKTLEAACIYVVGILVLENKIWFT